MKSDLIRWRGTPFIHGWRRGWDAGSRGRPLDSNPYENGKPTFTRNGGVSFIVAWRRAWDDGWEDGRLSRFQPRTTPSRPNLTPRKEPDPC